MTGPTNYETVLVTDYMGYLWAIYGTEYDGIEWLDPSSKPTQATMDAQWAAIPEPTNN
jgi:hypothetical protein